MDHPIQGQCDDSFDKWWSFIMDYYAREVAIVETLSAKSKRTQKPPAKILWWIRTHVSVWVCACVIIIFKGWGFGMSFASLLRTCLCTRSFISICAFIHLSVGLSIHHSLSLSSQSCLLLKTLYGRDAIKHPLPSFRHSAQQLQYTGKRQSPAQIFSWEFQAELSPFTNWIRVRVPWIHFTPWAGSGHGGLGSVKCVNTRQAYFLSASHPESTSFPPLIPLSLSLSLFLLIQTDPFHPQPLLGTWLPAGGCAFSTELQSGDKIFNAGLYLAFLVPQLLTQSSWAAERIHPYPCCFENTVAHYEPLFSKVRIVVLSMWRGFTEHIYWSIWQFMAPMAFPGLFWYAVFLFCSNRATLGCPRPDLSFDSSFLEIKVKSRD